MLTPERMAADAEAALMIDRAAGAPIPHDGLCEDCYKVGFAAGAAWALAKLKEQAT